MPRRHGTGRGVVQTIGVPRMVKPLAPGGQESAGRIPDGLRISHLDAEVLEVALAGFFKQDQLEWCHAKLLTDVEYVDVRYPECVKQTP